MSVIRCLIAASIGCLLQLPLPAQQAPAIGWYNGEWQSGIPGLANWYLGPDSFSRVYDEFEVPERGWTIAGVFSDNGIYEFPEVTHAHWEIRRSMSPGHGGEIVAKGISRATQMPDPGVTAERYPAGEAKKHFRIQVDGIQLQLPAGRYWLSVAPVGNGAAFLSATLGVNAIGTDRGRPGRALFYGDHGPAFVSAEGAGVRGEGGICQRFAQGVLIAK